MSCSTGLVLGSPSVTLALETDSPGAVPNVYPHRRGLRRAWRELQVRLASGEFDNRTSGQDDGIVVGERRRCDRGGSNEQQSDGGGAQRLADASGHLD